MPIIFVVGGGLSSLDDTDFIGDKRKGELW